MRRSMRNASGWLAVVFALAVAGCGEDPAQPEAQTELQKAPTKSGDQQTAPPGEALPAPLRVVVTRNGEPVAQVSVGWVTPSGGTMASSTSLTDANGISSMAWTLGPGTGIQTARASVVGALNSPVTFTAIAETDGGGGPPPDPQ